MLPICLSSPLARFSGLSRAHTRLMRATFLHGDIVASVVVVLIRCEITVPYCFDSDQNIWLLEVSWLLSELGFLNWVRKLAQGLSEVCTHSLQNKYYQAWTATPVARDSRANWCVPENSTKAPTQVAVQQPNAIEMAKKNQANTKLSKTLPNKLVSNINY